MKELLLEKTRLDGRYEILQILGRGSYAEIYLARDRQAASGSLHSSVVIKALNVFLQEEPDVELERTLIENFQNEAVALDLVRHPNVINRLGHGTARDLSGTIFHYLVLEYLPGGDLMQLCKLAPLSLEKTLLYLEQVCAGLAHAHAKGVIHRDIKPQNLLLTRDRQIVKIADFGVARFANVDSPITRVGTNVYAAPEHSPLNAALETEGGGNVRLTPAADVYSLAKTVYALLGGESPRKFSNAPITSLPPQLAEKSWASGVLTVLERATQSSLEARIKTVNDFWDEMYCAASEAEEATRVLNPALLTKIKSTENFTAQAPASPSFSSLPNVQIPVRAEPELPERPRLVVELGKTQVSSAAPVTGAAARRPPPLSRGETMLNGRAGAVDSNGGAINKLPRNTPLSQTVEQQQQVTIAQKPSRVAALLKQMAMRFAVVLFLLGAFAGVLAGTFNYLQTRGYLPTAIFKSDPILGHEAIVNQTVNLRADAGVANEDIGDIPNASRVKILKVKENWYEVEILKRSAPKINSADADRGWINGKYVDVQ